MIKTASDSNFELEVLKSNKPILVDFWAAWCGPCKMLAPVIEQIADNLKDLIDVAKVDVDANPNASFKYEISSIPTLVLFKDGEPISKFVGFRPAEQIEAAIKQALNV